MLEAAIAKIISLAAPTTKTVNGRMYSDKPMELVAEEKHFPKAMELSSLDSVCTMVRNERDKTDEKIFIRVKGPREVDVVR